MRQMQERWPGEDPRLYEDARQTVEGLAIVAERLRSADSTELLIDMYRDMETSGPIVGVRYAVKLEARGGVQVWRTIAIDAPLIWTKGQLEEEVLARAESMVAREYENYILLRADTGTPAMELLNALASPLPERQP